jgi:hypothetical protein
VWGGGGGGGLEEAPPSQLVILWLRLNVENVSRTTVGRDSHLKRDESQEIERV